MRYLTTTKNLFDISKVTETNNLKVIGNSIYSYYYPSVCNDTSTLSIFKSLKPDTNYTISATTLNYLGNATNYIMLIFSNANDPKNIFYNDSAGFNKVTFSLTQEQINNITYVYFYGRDESSGGPAIWNNIQIELGDTATDYVPCGYLPMYKGRYKVSDVCQLFDKSKYPATQTINGVTFTNNGDGTITVNGTATDRVQYNLYYEYFLPSTLIGHKCLIEPGVSLQGGTLIDFHSANWDVYYTKPIGEITELSSITIDVYAGSTANNLIFKPQLFDLTEMYGAGNEPTTVEEFRQKYPNELYPYSPYCWANMKNLTYKDDINYLKMK